MINPKIELSTDIFKGNNKLSLRDGYGQGLVEAGKKDNRVVVLCADVTESTRCNLFKKEFPDRFIEVGVAEQSLVTVASGMANYGKIPFISSYAIFSPGRNWEQIRTTVALNDVAVKIIGSHGGISVGEDGATHQALEDIALMRVIPNMVVVVPCDFTEAKKATLEAAFNGKPTYIRLSRESSPIITTDKTPFEIGEAEIFWEGKNPQIAIIACGPILYEAMLAANELEKDGVESLVVNNHTIKPLDSKTIIKVAKLTNAVVTVEEHQTSAGMGSAIAEVLSRNYPVPIGFMGISDSFGESGKADELLGKYKLKARNIMDLVYKILEQKQA